MDEENQRDGREQQQVQVPPRPTIKDKEEPEGHKVINYGQPINFPISGD